MTVEIRYAIGVDTILPANLLKIHVRGLGSRRKFRYFTGTAALSIFVNRVESRVFTLFFRQLPLEANFFTNFFHLFPAIRRILLILPKKKKKRGGKIKIWKSISNSL